MALVDRASVLRTGQSATAAAFRPSSQPRRGDPTHGPTQGRGVCPSQGHRGPDKKPGSPINKAPCACLPLSTPDPKVQPAFPSPRAAAAPVEKAQSRYDPSATFFDS
jgi:hypothetical protein